MYIKARVSNQLTASKLPTNLENVFLITVLGFLCAAAISSSRGNRNSSPPESSEAEVILIDKDKLKSKFL